MAISWFTKQRLRLNPNYIFRVKRESVTDEMIDYVLSRPNLDNELIKRLIYEFEYNNQLSEGTFQKIIDKIIDKKIPIEPDEIGSHVMKKYPKLLIHYMRTEENADSIRKLRYDKYIDTNNCSREELEEITDIYLEKIENYNDINHVFFNNQVTCERLLEHDFEGILKRRPFTKS